MQGAARGKMAVRAVGRDLEFHHVVVGTDDHGHVVTRLDILLVQDPDAVGDAVGELLLIGVEVLQSADVILDGVIGH